MGKIRGINILVAACRKRRREHDVAFSDDSGRWLKFTKPWCAGFTVEVIDGELLIVLATPLQVAGDSLNAFWERILASQVKLCSQNSSMKMSVLVFCNF
jgi:hypothetical protein